MTTPTHNGLRNCPKHVARNSPPPPPPTHRAPTTGGVRTVIGPHATSRNQTDGPMIGPSGICRRGCPKRRTNRRPPPASCCARWRPPASWPLLLIMSFTQAQKLLNRENACSILYFLHRFGAPSSAAPLCAAYSALPTFCATAWEEGSPLCVPSQGFFLIIQAVFSCPPGG